MLSVVTVAVALAGTVTDAGLTAHAGKLVVCCVDVTWQLRFTVPLNPLTDPISRTEDDVPPGPTASGLNEFACSVNSDVPWAAAKGVARIANVIAARISQKDAIPPRHPVSFNLDSNHSDLNMNEVWFK